MKTDRLKHDHRKSLWIIAGGNLLWCYRCGAWTVNKKSERGRNLWHRPTGPGGDNPAMKAGFREA